MPGYRRLLAVPLLVIALAGCDELNEATNALSKAEVCARAISAAGFTPDLSDPAKSVRDAQDRADQLRDLADQTSDADLQRELHEMADQVGSLRPSDVDPAAAATWTSRKIAQLTQLQQACG